MSVLGGFGDILSVRTESVVKCLRGLLVSAEKAGIGLFAVASVTGEATFGSTSSPIKS